MKASFNLPSTAIAWVAAKDLSVGEIVSVHVPAETVTGDLRLVTSSGLFDVETGQFCSDKDSFNNYYHRLPKGFQITLTQE